MKKRNKLFEEIKERNKDVVVTGLTTVEAAKLFDVTSSTIIEWTKKGKLKCRKTLGGHRRIPVSECERLIAKEKLIESN